MLAVLNPLTLLALIGGVHNDAIMVGLLVAGITAAKPGTRCWASSCARWPRPSRCRRPWASSTSPGTGPGPACRWRQRVRPLLNGGADLALAVMTVLSLVSGLGWGWIANLGTPGTVRSWMAPATAVGLVISGASTSSTSVSASAAC